MLCDARPSLPTPLDRSFQSLRSSLGDDNRSEAYHDRRRPFRPEACQDHTPIGGFRGQVEGATILSSSTTILIPRSFGNVEIRRLCAQSTNCIYIRPHNSSNHVCIPCGVRVSQLILTPYSAGESHGCSVTAIVDSCPPGLFLIKDAIQPQLTRRRLG